MEARNFIKKETPAQVFTLEFFKVLKNTSFTEHQLATVSDTNKATTQQIPLLIKLPNRSNKILSKTPSLFNFTLFIRTSIKNKKILRNEFVFPNSFYKWCLGKMCQQNLRMTRSTNSWPVKTDMATGNKDI